MHVSLSLLSQFTGPLPSTEKVAELLTFAGIEVEGIHTTGVSVDGVVVARILSSEPHPDADRLSVCKVDDGSVEPRQIVCGAKNYKVNDKVPLALPGAILPGDFKIKVSKLRGIKSEGMLCSGKELGLSADSGGLLILPQEAEVGAPIGTLYPPETTLELEITPNRPDLLSYAGLAREVCTLLGTTPQLPNGRAIAEAKGVKTVEVKMAALEACRFYTARRIRGVRVGPSPLWLTRALEGSGLRPINNIVDVTNYVLLEMGQPLHAFDAAKIRGAIEVRFAKRDEEFHALDGTRHSLKETHLVIADEKGPLALGGIMGGKDSGVTDGTTEIVLEAAWFEPVMIRRTARGLGLSSESSYRFERRVDPSTLLAAADRAVELILETAGGEAGELTLAGNADFPKRASLPRLVGLRFSRCLDLLGYPVTFDEVTRWLRGIGLEMVKTNGDRSDWRIPSFRPDLSREIDLIEEICRLAGMERIVGRTEAFFSASSPADAANDFRLAQSRRLAANGFFEVRTLTLVSRDQIARDPFALGAGLPLKNPMSEDHTHLRASLIPSLLAVMEANLRQGAVDLRLFEIGTVVTPEKEEQEYLALLVTGVEARRFRSAGGDRLGFAEIKGAMEAIGLADATIEKVAFNNLPFHAEVRLGTTAVGRVGALPSAEVKKLGARGAVYFAQFAMDALQTCLSGTPRYRAVPRFPAATRDLAVVVGMNVSHRAISEVIEQAGKPLLQQVELFDLYTDATGAKLPKDRKSLAYALVFRHPERTLTDGEVQEAYERVVGALHTQLAAELRA
ncbi:MAG: phenylalanine--tRNA ligase subunit beta [Verrucomicrobiia bacterium]